MKQTQPKEETAFHRALSACRVIFFYSALFGMVINALVLITPIYSMQVLDRVLSSQSKETLVMLTLVVLIVLITLALIQGARSFILLKMGAWLDQQLAPIVFMYTIRSSAEAKSIGASQNLRELNTLKNFLVSPQCTTLLDTPWSMIFLVVLFILHSWLGMLAVVGGVILLAMAYINEKSTKPLLEKTNEHYIKSMQLTEQASRNAEVINVMGLLPLVTRRWQRSNADLYYLQSKAGSRSAVLGEITKFVRMVIQIAVTGLGAYLVIKGELSAGGIIASSTLVSRALAPFEASIGSWKAVVGARKAYQKLSQLFEKNYHFSSGVAMPPPTGHLQVDGVYFAAAANQKPILKAITFEVMPGDVVAIIGSSGSGKTTLAKLLVGAIKPTVGTVRLDGVEMYDWAGEDKGRYVGYVPQDIELFSGTIRDNVGRMDPDAPDDAVVAAAQFVDVHEMIVRLPKGYDTEIGLEGSMLSGGQRQRVALARAFYGNPRFVVLDEPNSNLDTAGEAALTHALERAKKQKVTTIVISHRMALMGVVDKIVMVRDGMVVAAGPRDEILKQLQGGVPSPGNPASPGAAGPGAADPKSGPSKPIPPRPSSPTTISAKGSSVPEPSEGLSDGPTKAGQTKVRFQFTDRTRPSTSKPEDAAGSEAASEPSSPKRVVLKKSVTSDSSDKDAEA
jgi:PrtD family type I secretion system ABC transporter